MFEHDLMRKKGSHMCGNCMPRFGFTHSCMGVFMQASLATGAGARRLHLARTRASIQLLLVQACGEIWAAHGTVLSQACVRRLLDVLALLEEHAGSIDADKLLRAAVAEAQLRDQVSHHPHHTAHEVIPGGLSLECLQTLAIL